MKLLQLAKPALGLALSIRYCGNHSAGSYACFLEASLSCRLISVSPVWFSIAWCPSLRAAYSLCRGNCLLSCPHLTNNVKGLFLNTVCPYTCVCTWAASEGRHTLWSQPRFLCSLHSAIPWLCVRLVLYPHLRYKVSFAVIARCATQHEISCYNPQCNLRMAERVFPLSLTDCIVYKFPRKKKPLKKYH